MRFRELMTRVGGAVKVSTSIAQQVSVTEASTGMGVLTDYSVVFLPSRLPRCSGDAKNTSNH